MSYLFTADGLAVLFSVLAVVVVVMTKSALRWSKLEKVKKKSVELLESCGCRYDEQLGTSTIYKFLANVKRHLQDVMIYHRAIALRGERFDVKCALSGKSNIVFI